MELPSECTFHVSLFGGQRQSVSRTPWYLARSAMLRNRLLGTHQGPAPAPQVKAGSNARGRTDCFHDLECVNVANHVFGQLAFAVASIASNCANTCASMSCCAGDIGRCLLLSEARSGSNMSSCSNARIDDGILKCVRGASRCMPPR